MIKRGLSTFEREMKNKAFRAKFEKSYNEFILSELMIKLMDVSDKSVRKVAKEIGVSPTVIQNMRSGKQMDVKLSNFINISQACGYHLVLENEKERIMLC